MVVVACSNYMISGAGAQPSPGYYPSKTIRSMAFGEGYDNLWGGQHQTLSADQTALTVWMDRSSGSGFKSKRSYRNGYFGASIKVPSGYTAGVNTAFYVRYCLLDRIAGGRRPAIASCEFMKLLIIYV
jgi:xyloglucan:xyloglucosyl transferase